LENVRTKVYFVPRFLFAATSGLAADSAQVVGRVSPEQEYRNSIADIFGRTLPFRRIRTADRISGLVATITQFCP
jgi:hypothetical protein